MSIAIRIQSIRSHIQLPIVRRKGLYPIRQQRCNLHSHIQTLQQPAAPPTTNPKPPASPRVLVVGGGINGLSSAYQLLKAGYQVTVVADSFDQTTSHIAGASIVPASDTPIEEQPRILKYSQQTSEFLSQTRIRVGSKATGITLVSGYEFLPAKRVRHFWSQMMLGMRDVKKKELVAVLGAECAKQYDAGWHYTTFHVDTKLYLDWLLNEIRTLGGITHTAHISSLNDLRRPIPLLSSAAASPIQSFSNGLSQSFLTYLQQHPPCCVINCTGLASHQLVPDPLLYPSKGIILRVKNCPSLATHFYYDELNCLYIIPRLNDTVIGGVFGLGDWSTTLPDHFKEILLKEASRFGLDLQSIDIDRDVEVLVGHRPCRSKIRLELIRGEEPPPTADLEPIIIEPSTPAPSSDINHPSRHYSLISQKYVDQTSHPTPPPSSSTNAFIPMIHNYGHGGSGITVSMGCALEVVELMKTVAQPQPTST